MGLLIGMSKPHKGHDVCEILQPPALAKTLSTFDSSVYKCMQKIRTLIFEVEDNKQQKKGNTHGTSMALTLLILKLPWGQMAALSSWAIEANQPTFLKQKSLQYPIC